MASDYPGGLDDFTTIAADDKTSDTVGGRTHRDMHNDLGDAVEAIETELGTDPSGSAATVKARLDGIEDGTRLGANSVGATQIADNAVTSAKIADGTIVSGDVAAGQFAAFGTVGNLLTANQASGGDTLGNTTGFTAHTNCTLASSTAQALNGARSLAVTALAAGGVAALTDQRAVEAGQAVTASVVSRAATAGASCRVDLAFYTSGGSWLSTINGATASDTTTGWTALSVTGVAPATAALVLLSYNYLAADAGEVHYTDCFGLWRGAGGTWAMPGTPITNTGIRPNPLNAAEVQVWNDATATWITV